MIKKQKDNCDCSTGSCSGEPLVFTIGGESGIVIEPPKEAPSFVSGILQTAIGQVTQIRSEWDRADKWGQVKSRISAFRMEYIVPEGLYALGNPGETSDIFVSSNYKLSFDILRKNLEGLNAWILVLDTKGINVWCAAGKGSFGTEELILKLQNTGVRQLVSHQRIIVPQLGAPGIAASMVKKLTGFRVIFGPADAADIPEFINNSYKATPSMRKVKFSMKDRVILTPMEIIPAMKKFPMVALGFLLIFGLQPEGIIFRDAIFQGLPFILLGLLAVLSGAFITPLLLPFVPFRSFALKGIIMGGLVSAIFMDITGLIILPHIILTIAAYILFPLLSSYIALQFTGSTTYTGMTGVQKELKWSIPLYISGLVASSILVIIYKLIQWRLI